MPIKKNLFNPFIFFLTAYARKASLDGMEEQMDPKLEESETEKEPPYSIIGDTDAGLCPACGDARECPACYSQYEGNE